MKTIPNEPALSAPALAAKVLDQELNAPSVTAAASAPLPVNDLTSVVKKKKKPPVDGNTEPPKEAAGATKRKAEHDASSSPSEKKAKLEEAHAS